MAADPLTLLTPRLSYHLPYRRHLSLSHRHRLNRYPPQGRLSCLGYQLSHPTLLSHPTPLLHPTRLLHPTLLSHPPQPSHPLLPSHLRRP